MVGGGVLGIPNTALYTVFIVNWGGGGGIPITALSLPEQCLL